MGDVIPYPRGMTTTAPPPSDPAPGTPDTAPRIRVASPGDRTQVLAVRSRAIEESTALWTSVTPSPEASDAWFAAHLDAGSMIVAVDGDTVLGYACWSPLRSYDGYALTAENSVYLTEAAQGRGLGRALLERLISLAADQGVHSMVALIESGNEASIRLHERCGFAHAGGLREAGRKFDRWLDLTVMQRML